MASSSQQEFTVDNFKKNGFCIMPDWLSGQELLDIRMAAMAELENAQPPWELEAEVGYPFAPKSTNAEGGQTPRRLLHAFNRTPYFQYFATDTQLKYLMQRLLPASNVMLTQAHHNCLMTKLPQFSSNTGWHQDYRYWSFDSSNLVTAWLALGYENENNGGLQVVPGSHLLALQADQFCEKKFFKTNLPQNKIILNEAINVPLKPGDLLCFHANLLHCATRNNTLEPKLALVFTYHSSKNSPTPNTRSSLFPSIVIS